MLTFIVMIASDHLY